MKERPYRGRQVLVVVCPLVFSVTQMLQCQGYLGVIRRSRHAPAVPQELVDAG
jgi:hypothetical protein